MDNEVHFIQGLQHGYEGLGDLLDGPVQKKRQAYMKQMRVSQKEVDREWLAARRRGYGLTGWKPGVQLDFEMRQEIARTWLLAGMRGLPDNFVTAGLNLPPEDERKTLHAYLILEKMHSAGKTAVADDPALWRVSRAQRKRMLSAEELEKRKKDEENEEYRRRVKTRADPTRPDIGREMRANQHLRRYFHIFKEQRVIAISNVPFIPNLPPPKHTKRLRTDGRYGRHEASLYAQMHMPGQWHMPFSPAPTGVHKNPAKDLAWLVIDFDDENLVHYEGVDMYTVTKVLRDALNNTARAASEEFSYTDTLAPGAPYHAEESMRDACAHLTKHLMTKEEVLFQMAEFQRNLLELRAWAKYERALLAHRRFVRRLEVDWEHVMRPQDHQEISKDDRGVFVKDKDTANRYGHLQVPVWWLRGYHEDLVADLRRYGFEEILEVQESPFPEPETRILVAECDPTQKSWYGTVASGGQGDAQEHDEDEEDAVMDTGDDHAEAEGDAMDYEPYPAASSSVHVGDSPASPPARILALLPRDSEPPNSAHVHDEQAVSRNEDAAMQVDEGSDLEEGEVRDDQGASTSMSTGPSTPTSSAVSGKPRASIGAQPPRPPHHPPQRVVERRMLAAVAARPAPPRPLHRTPAKPSDRGHGSHPHQQRHLMVRSSDLSGPPKTKRVRAKDPTKANYWFEHLLRNAPLPRWWPTETRCPSLPDIVDTSRERMTRLHNDSNDPCKFKQFKLLHRTPRAIVFDKGEDPLIESWAVSRRYILRRVAFTGAEEMPGMDMEGWRRALKLLVVDERFDEYTKLLGLDVAFKTSANTTQAVAGAQDNEQQTIRGDDLEDNGEPLDDELFSRRVPESVLAEWREAAERGLGNDDSDSDDDYHEDDDVNAIFCEGAAEYLQAVPDAGEARLRSENERHKAEPKDWFKKPSASDVTPGITHFYEYWDNMMKPVGQTNKDFKQIQLIMECWFDYDHRYKIYFSHNAVEDGKRAVIGGRERLLKHPQVGEQADLRRQLVWEDWNGKPLPEAKIPR
ncbi:hypothetical protein AURDEDRAFT_177512, partial [Auricularia subglabra TFB-10046 SS5]